MTWISDKDTEMKRIGKKSCNGSFACLSPRLRLVGAGGGEAGGLLFCNFLATLVLNCKLCYIGDRLVHINLRLEE
ncbi:hypothetical protein CL630_01380 [bacterium]|nr:hypothetical protein [bacterium]